MTAILCRFDNANQKPVVFVADTIDYEQQTIRAWADGKMLDASLAYYHTTVPLSQDDNKALMQQFMAATSDPTVAIRDRLPRQSKQRPNLIASQGIVPQGASMQSAMLQTAVSQMGLSKERKRNPRSVPNRISNVSTGANGFTFDAVAAIEATRKEFNDKFDALLRACNVTK